MSVKHALGKVTSLSHDTDFVTLVKAV